MRGLECAAGERGVQGVPHFDIAGTVIVGAQRPAGLRQAIIEAVGRLAPKEPSL